MPRPRGRGVTMRTGADGASQRQAKTNLPQEPTGKRWRKGPGTVVSGTLTSEELAERREAGERRRQGRS